MLSKAVGKLLVYDSTNPKPCLLFEVRVKRGVVVRTRSGVAIQAVAVELFKQPSEEKGVGTRPSYTVTLLFVFCVCVLFSFNATAIRRPVKAPLCGSGSRQGERSDRTLTQTTRFNPQKPFSSHKALSLLCFQLLAALTGCTVKTQAFRLFKGQSEKHVLSQTNTFLSKPWLPTEPQQT